MRLAAVRRFIVFIGIVSVLIGLRLQDNGLLSFTREGRYTVFDAYDNATVYESVPLLHMRGAYERIDIHGYEADAEALLSRMRAQDIRIERVEALTIYYAYVPDISNAVKVNGRTVNVMIAVAGNAMTIGSPLIKGSY